MKAGLAGLSPRDRAVALAALACGTGAALAGLGLLATSADLVARAAQHPETVLLLWVPIVGVRFFAVARAALRYGERLFAHDAALRLLREIRVRAYRSLEPWFTNQGRGLGKADVLSRLVADVETLQAGFTGVVLPAVVAAAAVAGAAALGAWIHPWIGLLLLGALLASGSSLPGLAHGLGRGAARRAVTLEAEIAGHVVETVEGLADVVALGAEGATLARAGELEREWRRVASRLAWADAASAFATAAFTQGTPVAVLALASWLAAAQRIPPIAVPVAALLAVAANEAVARLPEAFTAWAGVGEARRRIEALAREGLRIAPAARTAAEDAADPPPALPARPGFAVRDVWLRYGPDAPWVLRGVSLTLAPGRTVALVGPSGAGKSSVVALLARLVEFARGRVEITGEGVDGVDVRRLAPEAVRELVAVVEQAPHVFDATLRENLLLAAPEATDHDLRRALATGGLDGLLARLPKGLDTPVGERGLALSEGERKRLAVARAVLRDAPVLLLDEPTEGLDAATARRVLGALLACARGRAVLLITHSPDEAALADEVLVMDAGRIVDRGRPEDLARRPGPFRELMRSGGTLPAAF